MGINLSQESLLTEVLAADKETAVNGYCIFRGSLRYSAANLGSQEEFYPQSTSATFDARAFLIGLT